MSWPALFPLEEDERSRGGTLLFRGKREFHCFGKAATLVSLSSCLVVSSLRTPGTHRVLTVNTRTSLVVFEGVECQVTKRCPGRKRLFSRPPWNIARLCSFHFTHPLFWGVRTPWAQNCNNSRISNNCFLTKPLDLTDLPISTRQVINFQSNAQGRTL